MAKYHQIKRWINFKSIYIRVQILFQQGEKTVPAKAGTEQSFKRTICMS
jgi:hypothetical protein